MFYDIEFNEIEGGWCFALIHRVTMEGNVAIEVSLLIRDREGVKSCRNHPDVPSIEIEKRPSWLFSSFIMTCIFKG